MRSGFTLVELLISLAVIGILSTSLVPSLLNARTSAHDSAARACANQLATAQEIYRIDQDTYAPSFVELDSGTVQTCDATWITSFSGDADTYSATVNHPAGNITVNVSPSGVQ